MEVRSEFVPVGTIIAYAGELDVKKQDELKNDGWLLCDGRKLANKDYDELYNSIGHNFGQPEEDKFNLPDFKGLFLRGVGKGSDLDKDIDSRTYLCEGGNTGDKVGSYQEYATAPPKNPFKANIPKSNIEEYKVDAGACVDSSGKCGDANTGAYTDGTGGDLETRPINKYVYYLIKYRNLNQYNEEVLIPIGAIIPFAGKKNGTITQAWTLCDGRNFSSSGEYKELYKAIGYVHGMESNGTFNIPDYRGYFLRGVDSGIKRDPEAKLRTSPFPNRSDDKEKGNSGDKVGSVQGSASAYPISGNFFTSIPHLPSQEQTPAITGAIKTVYKWNGDIQSINVTKEGGDSESRPVNIYVDWYIKYR